MSGSQEITAVATLDDGDATVSDTADTETTQDYIALDPTLTFNADGIITVTGSYEYVRGPVRPGAVTAAAGP